jgi:hypothetical protein
MMSQKNRSNCAHVHQNLALTNPSEWLREFFPVNRPATLKLLLSDPLEGDGRSPSCIPSFQVLQVNTLQIYISKIFLHSKVSVLHLSRQHNYSSCILAKYASSLLGMCPSRIHAKNASEKGAQFPLSINGTGFTQPNSFALDLVTETAHLSLNPD